MHYFTWAGLNATGAGSTQCVGCNQQLPDGMRAQLARLRPPAQGQLHAIRIHSNQNDPFFGGSYAYWKPGMPLRFAQAMSRPHGDVHFAGEHTATLHRGMEAAMESGERAALEILATL